MSVTSLAQDTPADDWPAAIWRTLSAADVRQVCHVPDAGHTRLINLCDADPGMRCVTLTSEEEGVGLLAGAWLGGRRGVLLMQSSGVGNCVNAFAFLRTCRIPFLAIIAMRGEWGEFNSWQVPMGQAARRVMAAMGLVVQDVRDRAAVAEAMEAALGLAFDGQQAVALTLSQELIGTKKFEE